MVRAVLAVIPFAFAVGCATADKPNLGVHGDAGFGHPDSDLPQLDSFIPADAPPGVREKTLSQTATETLTGGNSIACPAAGGAPGTSENHYYQDCANHGGIVPDMLPR